MGSCTSAPLDSSEKYDNEQANQNTTDINDEEISNNNTSHLPQDRYLREDIPKWFPSSNAHLDISSQFTIKHKIGDGVTGSVYSIFYKKTNTICALKRTLRSDEFGQMQFITEARCLSKLYHASIIKYIDMLMDDKYYYLILQQCDYDLWALMKRKKYLSEHQTKHIIHSLLKGVAHIHNKKLCHRDIKPENIVFQNANKNQAILIDFGDAEMAKINKIYTEFVGTPQYMSPERLGKHDADGLKKSDIWAVGVMTYEMFSGQPCFYGNTQKEVFSKILHGEWEWKLERMPSNELKDFVQECLHVDVDERLSANDALKHAWFADMTNRNKHEKRAVNKKQRVVTNHVMSDSNHESNNEHEQKSSAMEEICEYYGSGKTDMECTTSPPMDDYDTIGNGDGFVSTSVNIQSVQILSSEIDDK